MVSIRGKSKFEFSINFLLLSLLSLELSKKNYYIQIFVRTLTNEIIALRVKSNWTIVNIEDELQDKGSFPTHDYLTFSGKKLEYNRPLDYYGIKKDSILYCNLRLRGGTQKRQKDANDVQLKKRIKSENQEIENEKISIWHNFKFYKKTDNIKPLQSHEENRPFYYGKLILIGLILCASFSKYALIFIVKTNSIKI